MRARLCKWLTQRRGNHQGEKLTGIFSELSAGLGGVTASRLMSVGSRDGVFLPYRQRLNSSLILSSFSRFDYASRRFSFHLLLLVSHVVACRELKCGKSWRLFLKEAHSCFQRMRNFRFILSCLSCLFLLPGRFCFCYPDAFRFLSRMNVR